MSHADDEFHDRLQGLLYDHALALLAHGLDVIFEDGLWTKPERTQKLADARRLNVGANLHFLDLGLEELGRRIEYRNAELPHGAVPISNEELARSWAVFERPDPDELALFDEVFVHK